MNQANVSLVVLENTALATMHNNRVVLAAIRKRLLCLKKNNGLSYCFPEEAALTSIYNRLFFHDTEKAPLATMKRLTFVERLFQT